MTNAAFIFAICLGACVLATMLWVSHATVRKLEKDRRAATTSEVKLTPKEVHAAGDAPFERGTDLNIAERWGVQAPRLPESVS